MVDRDYWQKGEGSKHLVGRLSALNKKYPMIGTIEEYRPIVIQSPVLKFIEGKIIKPLKQYVSLKKVKSQFGFVQGVGI